MQAFGKYMGGIRYSNLVFGKYPANIKGFIAAATFPAALRREKVISSGNGIPLKIFRLNPNYLIYKGFQTPKDDDLVKSRLKMVS